MPYAAIPAVIGLAGAYMGSQASGDAADAQRQSSANSIAEQQREFDLIQGYQAPGRNLGYGADTLLAQLFGIPDPTKGGGYGSGAPSTGQPMGSWGTGPGGRFGGNLLGGGMIPGGSPSGGPGGAGSNKVGLSGPAGTPMFSNFYNSPDYQFSLDQGENAIRRQATANGSLYSTNTLNSMDQFAQGTASQHYNDYVQKLLAMAGLGGQAVAGTSAAAMNAGNNISSNMLSAGNANASGILGSQGAINSGLNSLNNVPWSSLFSSNGTQPGGYSNDSAGIGEGAGAYGVSDIRLKKNISRIGEMESGLPVYEFEYTFKPGRAIGVMAHEAALRFPDAVAVSDSGFMLVDYARIA